ncbi:MAG: PrsW family glutamic-type intramembrane protease [Bacteroidales bacterium]
MPKSLYISAALFLVIWFGLNQLVPEPSFSDLHQKVDHEQRSGQTIQALFTLKEILVEEPDNIDMHYSYINSHFYAPMQHQYSDGSWFHRDDDEIRHYYYGLSLSSNEEASDIGHYGLGLMASLADNYPEAITQFYRIRNRSQKYLNNSLGYAYQRLDSIDLAEGYYLREIELKGNLGGAYNNLSTLLFLKGEIEQIYALLDNPEARPFFNRQLLKNYYLRNHQFGAYALIHLNYVFQGLNIWGFLAAFLILLIWFFYLRRLDVFEPEKWKYLVVIMLLGMAFSFLTGPITDILNLGFNFTFSGELVNDFFYCFIGIGMIEELVKIIPLLILLRTTRVINEPYDYILYASLSALGFAFIENLIYFDEYRLHIIHGRALSAAVLHMFLSSVIAYGMLLNRFKRHRNKYLNFILFFLLASLLHGVYDFLILSPGLGNTMLLIGFFYIAVLTIWNGMINNALNHSDFFDQEKLIDSRKILDYLIYGLSGVLLFEFVALILRHGPATANEQMIASIYGGTILILFVSVKLSIFQLYKGAWAPIKIKSAIGADDNPESAVLLEGVEIRLLPFSNNALARKFIPGDGTIIRRYSLAEEPDWFLVKLVNTADAPGYLKNQVMIRIKDYNAKLLDNKILIALFAIPMATDLEKSELLRTDFSFCGWAMVE